MKRLIGFFAVLAMIVSVTTGCTEMNYSQRGALGGAAAGAIIGQHISHNDEGTLIGAAVGAFLGYMFGNEMDKNDRQMVAYAVNEPPNYPTSWRNRRTGNEFTVTPGIEHEEVYRPRSSRRQQRTYNNSRRQSSRSSAHTQRTCREARIDAVINGKHEVTYAKACWNEYRQIWELTR